MTWKHVNPYVLLIILAAVIFIPGLYTLPIVDRDSPHFAQATKQMLETGNYWQIKFQQKARHLKPPGIYWLQAASVKVFSDIKAYRVWPYRVPSVLGGLLAILFTFYFARKFYSEKVALFSAALLASAPLLIIESHLATTDAALLATMVLMQGALWQIYVKSRKEETISWGLVLLFWLAMAAGVLIKGITPLVGFLTLISLAIVDRSLAIFKNTKFLWGLLILIGCSVWLIPVSLAGKSNFLWDMIHGDVLPKLISGQQSHGMPPGYFLLIFTLMFFPGALFIWHGIMWGWQNRKQAVERFLLAWIIPTWIFFELVHTKLPEYVLPTYPAIAILVASAVNNHRAIKWRKIPAFLNKLQQAIWLIFGILLSGAFLYIPHFITGNWSILGIIAAIIIIIVMIIALVNTHQRAYTRATAITIIGITLAFLPIWQWVLPSLKPLWISEKIVGIAKKYGSITANKPLLSVGYGEPSLVFLTGTRDVVFISPKQAVTRLKNNAGELVIVDKRLKSALLQSAQQENIKLQVLSTIHGFNYSKGRWITLILYK